MSSTDQASVGARMQVARLMLGKTPQDVAKDVGVTSNTYRAYESGNRPLGDRIDEVANHLQVTVDFLNAGPIRVVPTTALSYRKREILRQPHVRHVQGLASMAIEYGRLMERHISMPPVRVPYTPVKSLEDVDDAVRKIRDQIQIADAPLRSAIDLVEHLGVFVFWVNGDPAFDGVSFWDGDRPYILLNRNIRDGYRSRFTVLHECGHLCCHRASTDADRHEEERRILDTEANRFAAAFLLPAASFARRFPRYPTLDAIADERSYWMASCAAMVYRARQLKLIDEDQYRRLNVGISSRGWRKSEPGAMRPETSKVHQFFLDEVGDKGLGPFDLALSVPCPTQWLTEALPSSDPYLNQVSFDDLLGF